MCANISPFLCPCSQHEIMQASTTHSGTHHNTNQFGKKRLRWRPAGLPESPRPPSLSFFMKKFCAQKLDGVNALFTASKSTKTVIASCPPQARLTGVRTPGTRGPTSHST